MTVSTRTKIDVKVDANGSLYETEAKIYPRSVKGRFASLRLLAMTVLLGLFYIIPWISWDGRQTVLFDLPARKFYIFGLTLWPQDFVYLAGLLIVAGLALFFFTALGGRLWCGFACPQTVWTEAFLLMERWVEGDRNRRMKLDKASWNTSKLLRKSVKQTLWIAFSLWTGLTFVGYFSAIRPLTLDLLAFSIGPWEAFWLLFYGFATYGNAGFMREQVCKYMCPYARFQSAMFDKDTMIIAYDEKRGEPRGGRSRKAPRGHNGLGDCVNCTLCVQVCPTGIDIREGLQYECIACAACIDACDDVMAKLDYPKGLIRYTTESELTGTRGRLLRPRTVIYALLLLTVIGGIVMSIATRVPVRAEVLHDRNALFRVVSDGVVENVYSLRLINMRDQASTYNIALDGLNSASVQPATVTVAASASAAIPLTIQARESRSGGVPIQIVIKADDNPDVGVTRDARFYFPF